MQYLFKMKLNCIIFMIINTFCIRVESIFNGSFVSVKEAPFYVSMTIFHSEICGGSIIAEYWIISAAHCFNNFRDDLVRIRSGSSTAAVKGRKHKIEKVLIPENFNIPDSRKGTHDISLIKLKQPIVFDEFQQPIQISRDPPQDDDKAIIYGLGHQGSTRTNTLVLKMVELNIISKKDCQQLWYETDGVFCSGDGITSANVCKGDSGGPVVIDGKLAGVVSHGFPCKVSNKGSPGFHTRVHKHYDWIMKHTGIKY